MNDSTTTESFGATILRIQRLSTEDGPGIRSTVFFKGCPLNCIWCHNPESISSSVQVHWVGTRCIGCRTCLETCPNEALSISPGGIRIDRSRCKGCLACTKACPSTSLEPLGVRWGLEELTDEVLKDRVYFEKSGGGITLSGGEPTMQSSFAGEFLKSLKEAGIHTTLDTCGQCSFKTLESLLFHTDLVLYDLKEIDPEKHRRFTGVSNDKILENLIFLAGHMKTRAIPRQLWIRTPVIPGHTATKENIAGIGKFIADNLREHVSRWELCSFNNLCIHKYEGLGIMWPCRDYELLSEEDMEYYSDVARRSGVDPGIVHATGSTRLSKTKAPEEDNTSLHMVKGDVQM